MNMYSVLQVVLIEMSCNTEYSFIRSSGFSLQTQLGDIGSRQKQAIIIIARSNLRVVLSSPLKYIF